ncbi:septal ring lytic transglycosylase RlpA family protein [Duganella aceris]|nr:SPOR domain-containing protein [Duganella aceris]
MLKVSVLTAALALVGCGSLPTEESGPLSKSSRVHPPVIKAPSTTKPATTLPVLPPANSGRGGYYQDDGPGDAPPANLADVPDADVRNDPLLPRSNRPYVVFGKTYTPLTDNQPYSQIGVGSWYGKKFHGQRTSSGELYDMYKMTAAHPTLPIPSYARLTNMVSGAVVVVRINDRGPFHASRAIDVSYTAALKLGLLGKGSHELKIERILPDEIDRMQASREGVSGTTKPRLQSQSKDRLVTATPPPSAPSLIQPLVLSPQPVPSALTPQVTALMLSDRAPDEASMPTASTAPSASATPAMPGLGAPAAAGFYIQLGAYSRAENAEAVRGKLAGTGLNGLEVVQAGSVHRLFSGPFATRQEALLAAQGLPSSLSLKPIVIQR